MTLTGCCLYGIFVICICTYVAFLWPPLECATEMFRAEHDYAYTTKASDTAPIVPYTLLVIFVITHKVLMIFYIYYMVYRTYIGKCFYVFVYIHMYFELVFL